MKPVLIVLLLFLATPARAGDGRPSTSVPSDATANAPGYWRDSGAPCRPFSRWCDSAWQRAYGPAYKQRREDR